MDMDCPARAAAAALQNNVSESNDTQNLISLPPSVNPSTNIATQAAKQHTGAVPEISLAKSRRRKVPEGFNHEQDEGFEMFTPPTSYCYSRTFSLLAQIFGWHAPPPLSSPANAGEDEGGVSAFFAFFAVKSLLWLRLCRATSGCADFYANC
jgi:hypothetical protein